MLDDHADIIAIAVRVREANSSCLYEEAEADLSEDAYFPMKAPELLDYCPQYRAMDCGADDYDTSVGASFSYESFAQLYRDQM